MREKTYWRILGILTGIFVIMMGMINLLVIFFKHGTNYIWKKEFLIAEPLLAMGAVLTFFLLFFLRNRFQGEAHANRQEKAIRWASVILFLLQIYICYNIYFETDWDVQVIVSNARSILAGHPEELNNGYFSRYPTNMFLLWFVTNCLKWNQIIGVLDTESGYMFMITIQCLMATGAGYILFHLIYDFTQKYLLAWSGWVMFLILVGLPSWVLIPYTDSLGLIFPVLLFGCYGKAKQGEHRMLYMVLFLLLSVLGFRIKPQIFIICIAIFLVEFLRNLFRLRRKQMALCLLAAVSVIVGVKVEDICLANWAEHSGFVLNAEEEISWTHFLMMGSNRESNGVYNDSDVEFSIAIKDPKERKAENLRVVKERISSYGLGGTGKHIAKKMLVNYGDGTFAFGNEGVFYMKDSELKNSYMAPKLRDFFLSKGRNYSKNAVIKQFVWIAVLLFSLGNLCLIRKRSQEKEFMVVLMVSIIGLTLFEILFEARARYLYTYVPLFILIALKGMDEWMNRLEWRKEYGTKSQK